MPLWPCSWLSLLLLLLLPLAPAHPACHLLIVLVCLVSLSVRQAAVPHAAVLLLALRLRC